MSADLATLRALKERRSTALLKATAMRFLAHLAEQDGDPASVEVNCCRGLAYLAEADRLDALISRAGKVIGWLPHDAPLPAAPEARS